MKTAIIMLNLALLLASGCTAGKYRDFFSLPIDQQHRVFLEMPIEKQYEIYIYSMLKRHPPRQDLAYCLATEGETIVPYLANRIKASISDVEKQVAIYVIEIMKTKNIYDVSKDAELLNLLKTVIKNMKQPRQKSLSQESLKTIMEQSP